MVRITLAPFRMQADGHAGFAEPGKDIVCAAVSALLQALGVGIERLARYGRVTAKTVEFKDGQALLSATPIAESEGEVRLLFDVFGESLLRLAEEYSEYVEVMACGLDPM